MTTRRYLIAVDLDDADLTDVDATISETIDALTARMEPEACFVDGAAIRGKFVSGWDATDSFDVLLNAMRVGLEGLEDPDTRDMVGVTAAQVDDALVTLAALTPERVA